MLGSKTFYRPDELPSLKLGNPGFKRDIYNSGSALNSPLRVDSQTESPDNTIWKSYSGKKKKLMGMTLSNMPSRILEY
jgi:hypothetical protein